MEAPYKVYEESDNIPGEFILRGITETLEDAREIAETVDNAVIEETNDGVSRIIEIIE